MWNWEAVRYDYVCKYALKSGWTNRWQQTENEWQIWFTCITYNACTYGKYRMIYILSSSSSLLLLLLLLFGIQWRMFEVSTMNVYNTSNESPFIWYNFCYSSPIRHPYTAHYKSQSFGLSSLIRCMQITHNNKSKQTRSLMRDENNGFLISTVFLIKLHAFAH